MAQSREESAPSRIELIVLACLSQSRPPSDIDLGDAIHELALPNESPEVARQRAGELLARLVRRAWVTSDDVASKQSKKGRAPSPRTLTGDGERVLREAFHLPHVPTWAQVRDKHLPALALGQSRNAELAGACTETALIAAVLGARFGIRDATTPLAVCDALIANALGMPPGKLTLESMRAHVLQRGIDRKTQGIPTQGSKGYAARLAAWIACNDVGAGENPRRMARALARRWVCGEVLPPAGGAALPPQIASPPAAIASPPAAVAVTPQPPQTPPSPQPATSNLLEVVRETISRIGAEGRFGEKVYVSAIWRSIERDRKVGDLSLDYFKRWLVRANRDGWLVLARADLIGAMDAKQINESEINDRGATFHFVLDQRNGASVSQRESHAG